MTQWFTNSYKLRNYNVDRSISNLTANQIITVFGQIQSEMYICLQEHLYTYIHTISHMHTHIFTHTPSHTHTFPHTHTRSHLHTYTRSHFTHIHDHRIKSWHRNSIFEFLINIKYLIIIFFWWFLNCFNMCNHSKFTLNLSVKM